jgi:hypothetical protein
MELQLTRVLLKSIEVTMFKGFYEDARGAVYECEVNPYVCPVIVKEAVSVRGKTFSALRLMGISGEFRFYAYLPLESTETSEPKKRKQK